MALIPRGTLVERIRAGGCGLVGVLTAPAPGTSVAEGKQVVEVDGKPLLPEGPIRGDFALPALHCAGHAGNLGHMLTAHDFNRVRAMAADTLIDEAEHILPVGMIPPDAVKTPGVPFDQPITKSA